MGSHPRDKTLARSAIHRSEVTEMARRGEKQSTFIKARSARSARKEPSHPSEVAVIHYPDEHIVAFWRARMTPREFARAIATYSRLVESE
jgi:hypothetical protein